MGPLSINKPQELRLKDRTITVWDGPAELIRLKFGDLTKVTSQEVLDFMSEKTREVL